MHTPTQLASTNSATAAISRLLSTAAATVRLSFFLCRSSVARRKAKLANMRSTAHTPVVPSACMRSCTRSCPAQLSLSRRVQATLSHKVKGAAVCKRAPQLFQALSHQKETEQAAPLNPSSCRVPVTYFPPFMFTCQQFFTVANLTICFFF